MGSEIGYPKPRLGPEMRAVWESGRWAVIAPEFPGDADQPPHLAVTLSRALIDDKDRPIWPIL